MSVPQRSWLPWIVLALALYAGWYFRDLLALLGTSFALAYLLEPLVERLEKLGLPRSLAIVSVLLTATVLLSGLLAIVVPNIVHEFSELSAKLPNTMRTAVIPRLNRGLLELRHRYHVRVPITADAWLGQLGSRADLAPRSFAAVVSAASATISALEFGIEVLIVLAMAFYLLQDWRPTLDRVTELVPNAARPQFVSIVGRLDTTMGRYLRGQLVVMGILGALFSVGLTALGVPAGLGLGVLAGMISFIPYVGFLIALCLAVLLSALDGSGGTHVLLVLGFMAAVHVLDITVLTPRILGGSIGLSPVAVILSLLAGAKLLGFAGLLIAIPMAAMLRVLLSEAVAWYQSTHFYRDPPAVRSTPP